MSIAPLPFCFGGNSPGVRLASRARSSKKNGVRKGALAAMLVIVGCSSLRAAQVEKAEVNLDYVTQLAEKRAREPFHSRHLDLPESLRPDRLNYGRYQKIHFRGERALWLGDKLPFGVEFFHPGYLYQDPVRMFEFTKTHVQHIRFVQDWFDYSDLEIDKHLPADLDYAGCKIVGHVDLPDEYAELASFLGASYFRMLGKGQHYGLSARGLALDCGVPDQKEEFPLFTDFWLGKPSAEDGVAVIFALLDSVSCTGAYEFHVQPGETTFADINAVLFFREPDKTKAADSSRKPIAMIGLAPLSSMFWFGENSERRFDDYRPEVHDSDGLLLHFDGGEIVWRPLCNTASLRHSVFSARNIRGFGLFQRDREFAHYEDLASGYQDRPSVWIKPKEDWGDGEVHLLEFPTNKEGLDNIACYWNPLQKPQPLQPFRFGYQLCWTREKDFQLSSNRVNATRICADWENPQARQVFVDFAGPNLNPIPETEAPQAVVICSGKGKILGSQVMRNAYSGGWRVMIRFEPDQGAKDPLELRCTLKKGEATVSETWSYQWSPL